jgi:hypothetical protein
MTTQPQPPAAGNTQRRTPEQLAQQQFEYRAEQLLKPGVVTADEVAGIRSRYTTGAMRLRMLNELADGRPIPANTPSAQAAAPVHPPAATPPVTSGASASDFDFDVVDPEAREQIVPVYSLAQWINGQPKLQALAFARTGGVFLPNNKAPDGLTLPGWDTIEYIFEGGEKESGLAAQTVTFAVIRTRFRWFITRDGQTTHYPRQAYVKGVGMRGKLQLLAAIYGAPVPIVITFTGKGSQSADNALREFQAKIVSVANQTAPANQSLPRYAFYLRLVAGAPIKVGPRGQESIITPPTLILPETIDRAYLKKIYVTRERLLLFQSWFRDAELWAKEWETFTPESSDGAPPDELEESGTW